MHRDLFWMNRGATVSRGLHTALPSSTVSVTAGAYTRGSGHLVDTVLQFIYAVVEQAALVQMTEAKPSSRRIFWKLGSDSLAIVSLDCFTRDS